MKSVNSFVLCSVAVAALAGCGGGGGGGAVGAGPVAVVQVEPVPDSNIVSSVPAPGYANAAEELAAYNVLNSARGDCGFGLLAQNTKLDVAARAHADYQLINNIASHSENQQQYPTGFTGSSPEERATAAGYTDFGAIADEISIITGITDKSGMGEIRMRSLLSAPYHLAGLMSGYRDVGISVRSSSETSPKAVNDAVYLQVNAGFKYATGRQLLASSSIATYPCQGSSGVKRLLVGEKPNPVPGRDLAVNPIGTPIYIATRFGDSLTIASASMKETVSNTAVVLRTPIVSSNDPNSYYQTHEGYVAPDAPLLANTQYTVTITGAVNGVAFRQPKTFTFTTGL